MQKLTSLLMLLVCFGLHAYAQQTVSGKVTADSSGAPLDGVTVSVKDGKTATQTTKDGSFRLNASPNATLIFSYVGYNSREVAVNGQSFLNVQLQAMAQNLQDVVVIGYGTQRKSNVTGSIASISSSAYKDQPVVNVSSALQGRASGVSVSSASGAPGGVVKIRIRGANSINSSNDPLFVVDGVALGSISFQDINVNDIESMEVLKDASATAIYGSRGANGVVIITTKSGKTGKMTLNANGFVTANHIKKYDVLGPVAYAEQANHIAGTDVFTDPQSYAGKGTNWQDQVFQTGYTQNYQVSLGGGTEKSRYYISGYYVKQSGIVVNTSQQKIALRSNIDSRLSKKLSVGLNMFLTNIQSKNNGDMGSKASPVTSSLTWAPTEPVYDDPATGAYNRYAISPIGPNPYMIAKESDYEGKSNTAVVNAKLKWDITDWLSFNTNVGVDANFYRSGYVNNEWINESSQSSGQGSSENYTLQNSNGLTYHQTFNGVHNLSVTGVYEQTSNKYNGFNADGGGLTSLSYGYYALQLNASQGISSFYSNWGLQSYLGRITYDYKGKYMLMATYRADGSSKFQSTGNKWAYFPSFSAGWKISEEDFMKDITAVSNLKLRGSWGKTGNQAIAPYSTLGLLTGQQYSYGSSTAYQGYTLGNPPNLNLKWETTTQWDIGIDAALFSNRLNVTLDYFNKLTDGLLLQKTIPDYDGGGSQWVNLGAVSNKGFEFSVSALAVNSHKFSWNTTLNISALQNKVKSIGDQDIVYVGYPGSGLINTSIQVVKPGSPLGAFYLIPWEGVYKEADATLGFEPGDNKYKDVDGSGSIGYEDRVVRGNPIPKLQLGFSNDFTYGNFTLNLFIQGVQGNKIFNATYAAVAAPTSDIKYPTLAASASYWTKSNTNSEWADPASKTGRSYVESTHYLQDGSYIRLKNISLSYLLSKKMIGFGDISLSLSAQNLFTITKYKGFDPEADTQGNTDIAAGIDLGAYPNPRSFTIGINANF
ncbi:SusC/RagA family TonB-linked outer membrane protein [Parafilimonas sp.]|uniref:SusC/RagA family TonB-linked outer membrane protein n=1 Tax=Parafilimonas sp. TaxID=1969739 RepID=UPI0039E67601